MIYKLEVRPLAAQEIIEAFDWYEIKKEGLGSEFLYELDKFFESLRKRPLNYSYYDKPVRRGSLGRFPYIVTFEVLNELIIVYSVFMTKQDPQKRNRI